MTASSMFFSYNESSSCFWDINNTQSFSAINDTTVSLTLDCSSYPNSMVHVLSGEYMRPPGRNDRICFENLENCCRNRNRICRVPFQAELTESLKYVCSGRVSCTVDIGALHLSECQNKCDYNISEGINGTVNWCWARWAKVNFLCQMFGKYHF